MANQVVIELDEPANVKDGFKVSIADAKGDKKSANILVLDTLESKIGFQVNIQDNASPKTW